MSTNHIRQSIARWCFPKMTLDELCVHAQRIGYGGIDLVGPDDWPTLQRHGLVATLCPSHPIGQGLNRRENHDRCLTAIRASIDACAAHGYPNVVCFSGNRDGLGDEEGLIASAEGLRQIAPHAEARGVTLCVELLNSKDHPGYMCDRSAWGVRLCELVKSPRVKLLYDIYHMQRMEGDVIATIRASHAHIGHYHTAGCPGRHELDGSQELHYPAIVRAIAETGYDGWIGQEFLPSGDPVAGLEAAFAVCGG